MARFSWKRGKTYDGLRTLPATYELRFAGKSLATAQELREGGWFWYGGDRNTAGAPDTLENVKADAVAYFRDRVVKRPPQATDTAHE